MDWTQTLSIIVVILSSTYFLHCKIQINFRIIKEEIKNQITKNDKHYEIFSDLIKIKKENSKSVNRIK